MNRLSNAIRSKRYLPKKNNAITITISSPSGENLDFQLVDCSQSGLRGKISIDQFQKSLIDNNTIISSSKITFPTGELFTGRLAVRRIYEPTKDSTIDVAFSAIDTKIEVDGKLSHHLDVDLNKNESKEELNPNFFSLAHFVENEYTNIDLFDRLNKFDVFAKEWLKAEKYAYNVIRESSKGSRVKLERARPGGRKDYIVMGSNDYFGLSSHPDVIDAIKRAVENYGFSSTGSPVTTGGTDLHRELSKKLAKIHKKEAAVLFNSGYAANLGVIASITTSNDLIIADQLSHASIQDAMQMSKATSRFFKHNSAEHLDSILEKERSNFNGCLIVTEGVFSMDGDLAKLDEIFSVARKYNCRILVDQAHCFGVVGPNGLGITEKYHLMEEVDIIMGTFSKVCGGIGGYIAGSSTLINWIRHMSRAHLFSVSLPPSTVAGVSKSIDIFIENRSLVETLRKNISHFINNLNSLGFKNNPNHESSIIPVVIGDESLMGKMYQSLLDDGIWCTPIVYPAVGRKNCRFRFTIMATHSLSDLDYATICLEKAMMKVGFNPNDTSKSDKKKAA